MLTSEEEELSLKKRKASGRGGEGGGSEGLGGVEGGGTCGSDENIRKDLGGGLWGVKHLRHIKVEREEEGGGVVQRKFAPIAEKLEAIEAREGRKRVVAPHTHRRLSPKEGGGPLQEKKRIRREIDAPVARAVKVEGAGPGLGVEGGGGVMLGPLPLVTSAPIASAPNPH